MNATRKPERRASNGPTVTLDGWHGTYGSLGYRATRVAASEHRAYSSYPGSAHDDRDRTKLIAQSRQFMRDNAIYKGLIERMVSYIVGNGFELQITGVSKTATVRIERLWKDFMRRPEIRNLLSGGETGRMIMRELFVAGDTLALKTDKGLLQLFEAEQIDGDKSYPAGIKKDVYGRPSRFHLCPWKNNSIDKRNGRGVMAKDVLFLTNPERSSSVRGIPACQASFPMLHRINDICDSEAIAWQLLSRLAVKITRQKGDEIAVTESVEDADKSAEQLEDDLARRVTELGYALFFHGEPGDEIGGIERNIPGKDFPDSVRMFLRLLGLPIGAPLELVLLDWTKSNYSQSRAVLEQAYENFIFWQKKMIDFFYAPLFDWKWEAWKSIVGANVKPVAGWILPTFPWIDQLKEALAWAAKLDRGYTTHAAVCKSLKADRAEVLEQREKEIREAIEISKRIEADTEVAVPYEIFCGLQPPGSSATPFPSDDDDDEEEKKKKEDDE